MKKIQTKSGTILCVEVYNDWHDFNITMFDTIRCKDSKGRYARVCVLKEDLEDETNFEIVGKLSELTDKDCEEFVEKHPNIQYRDYMVSTLSKSINGWTVNWVKPTAKESFISLLQSEDVDTTKEYLIIQIL